MFGNNGSKRRMPKPLYGLFFLVMAGLFVFILGHVIVFLWNEILVDVTGVKPLNFWQAIGLFALSRILFGGFRFGGPRHHYARKRKAAWKQKWMNMSEDEREEFKNKWKKRCSDKD